MDVAAPGCRDLPEGGIEQGRADVEHLVAVVGMDHDLERPRIVAVGELGVADRMGMVGFPGDESGEPRTAALDEVEPEVVRERAVAVGALGCVDQLTDLRDL